MNNNQFLPDIYPVGELYQSIIPSKYVPALEENDSKMSFEILMVPILLELKTDSNLRQISKDQNIYQSLASIVQTIKIVRDCDIGSSEAYNNSGNVIGTINITIPKLYRTSDILLPPGFSLFLCTKNADTVLYSCDTRNETDQPITFFIHFTPYTDLYRFSAIVEIPRNVIVLQPKLPKILQFVYSGCFKHDAKINECFECPLCNQNLPHEDYTTVMSYNKTALQRLICLVYTLLPVGCFK